ncbi:unnamed protein product, partial [Allacma fusca]
FTISTALDAYLCGNQLAIPAVERHAVKVLKSKGAEIKDSDCFKKFLANNVELVPNMFYLMAVPEKIH